MKGRRERGLVVVVKPESQGIAFWMFWLKVPSPSKQFQPCMLQVRLFCGRPSQESMFSCHRLRVTSYISICIAASLLLAHPTTAYKLQAPKGVGRDGRVQLGLSEAI